MRSEFFAQLPKARPEPGPPLDRIHRWLRKSRPNAFDKPTEQELALVFSAIFLAPILLLFAAIYVLFQPFFTELRPPKRVLFLLALPFMLPAAYCYVLVADLLIPMFKRIRLRRKLLRQAAFAVRDLMNDPRPIQR